MNSSADQFLQQALGAHAQRDLPLAERLLRRLLEIDPKNIDALNGLALVAQDAGNLAAAIALLKRAVALRPGLAMLHNNLAEAYRRAGQHRECEASYRRAIAADPDYARSYANLGCLAMDHQAWEQAEKLQRKAIELDPNLAQAHNNLGEIFRRRGDLKSAEACYRRAAELEPHHALAWSNLGGVLVEQDRVDEAVECLERSIAERPGFAPGHNNLGHVLVSLGRLDEARARFEKAIALQKDYADAHFNLGVLRLLEGDWNVGFAEWEWRWELSSAPRRSEKLSQAAWNGEELENKTLLLYAEQGLGDTLQSVRYVRQAVQRLRGQQSKILIAAPNELVRLLANSVEEFAGEFAARTRVVSIFSKEVPRYEAHVALMSLPRIFGTAPQTIPSLPHYLRAVESEIEAWGARLRDATGAAVSGDALWQRSPLKVGLAWAGNPSHRNDRQRSFHPQLLCGLSAAARRRPIQFISLQKYLDRPALAAPKELNLIDFTSQIRDFADTAALIANLDLIISVDTAVIHLAGAMGKRVWTLLSYAPDWRWGLSGQTTGWYPAMRLFRQTAHGDWPTVIERVAKELERI